MPEETIAEPHVGAARSPREREPAAREPGASFAPIGPFRVLELLGEGGMGRVFLAEQTEPVLRRVALKVMQELARSPQAIARFLAERQAMARLAHPSIAQIFEAGTTEEGWPYFAMEWVDGPWLTRYCDHHRLSVPDRLRLFIAVCRGVEHAHQRQVLHRDLKPSNVLVAEVDGQPVPKIIDFGIAKGLDGPLAGATLATGDRLLGTPEYMSPEALGLEGGGVDTRSDVFSLGVLLYELLTGALPFGEVRDFGELLARRNAPLPPKPSTRFGGLTAADRLRAAELRGGASAELSKHLKGDLDWIVMKAIRPEREERYGSAAALADDLERSLADQPILARPPSTLYLLRKLARRHRAAVAASALALLLLVAGIVGTSLALVRARRAEARATNEAESSRRVAGFLSDLFRGADPNGLRGGKVSARDLLTAGAAKLGAGLKDEPLIRARLLGTVGEIHHKLGLFEEAQGLLDESLRLSEAGLPAADPELGRAAHRLGSLAAGRGKFAEAEPLLERARGIFERADPPDLADLAQVECDLGVLDFNQGKAADAAPHFERAISAAERSLPEDDPTLARAVGNLAAAKQRLGDYEAALALAERALALEEGSGRGVTAGLGYRLINLGVIHGRLGRVAESRAAYQRAYQVLVESLGADHPTTLQTLMNLGVSERRLGKNTEAEKLFRQALAGQVAKLTMEHPLTLDTHFKLALLLWQTGRLGEAAALFRERVAIFRRLGETTKNDVREELAYLGTVLAADGRREEAEAVLREALAESLASPAAGEPYVLTYAYQSLGNLCRDSGRQAEAESLYRRGLALFTANETNPERGEYQVPARSELVADFARLLRATGRAAEAAALR